MKFMVFDQEANFERFRPRLPGLRVQLDSRCRSNTSTPTSARFRRSSTTSTPTAPIVIEYMGRAERVTSDNEQDLTNALIKVLNPQQKKVYFLSGHGEKDPASQTRSRVQRHRRRVEARQLPVRQAGARADQRDPGRRHGDRHRRSAHGPARAGSAADHRGYLAKDGKLLVMLDPPKISSGRHRCRRLTALLKEWGINATESVVVDLSGRTQVATVPVAAPPYPTHAITQQFGLITMFPLARAITPANDAPAGSHGAIVRPDGRRAAGRRRTSLARESPTACLRNPRRVTWPARSRSLWPLPSLPHRPRSRTQLPPRIHPRRIKAPKPETRVAAIGDSDFAANAYLGDRRQPRSVHEHRELAGAAGEPDRDQTARRGGPANHADGEHISRHVLDRRSS